MLWLFHNLFYSTIRSSSEEVDCIDENDILEIKQEDSANISLSASESSQCRSSHAWGQEVQKKVVVCFLLTIFIINLQSLCAETVQWQVSTVFEFGRRKHFRNLCGIRGANTKTEHYRTSLFQFSGEDNRGRSSSKCRQSNRGQSIGFSVWGNWQILFRSFKIDVHK